MPILMVLFIVPFLLAIAAFAFPAISGKMFKRLAFLMSLIPLGILLYGQSRWLGTKVQIDWIPPLNVQFYLSVDALSFLFLYLTAIIVPVSLMAVRSDKLTSPNLFYGFIFLLQGLLIGFFTSRDLALFTLFWEAMLLPLYFIIAYWGGDKRRTASLKFLIYMIAGSALMIAAVLFLYIASSSNGVGTFNMDVLPKVAATAPYAAWIGAIFLLAFAVKTPLFPFHAWLPDAYYEAPVAGTILLSAILSKAGIYGFLRIGMELFPTLIKEWSPLLLGLAITGVFYGALAAWRQKDYKRLVAYSSLSHVNFILAGVFILNQAAQGGAILQSLNHGVTIAALFLVAGWLETRLGTTSMDKFGGLAKYIPHLCWTTLFFVLASVALPGTNNFIGELMILFGLFEQNPWLAGVLGISIILSVVYMLRWMRKMYFGAPHDDLGKVADIHAKELLMALPLMLLILWVGLYPTPILDKVKKAQTIADSNEKLSVVGLND